MSTIPSQGTARGLPQTCAGLAIGIAVLALVGWLTAARQLAGQWGDYVPMAPSTALALVFLGGALFTVVRWPSERLARHAALAAASVVSVLALLVLAQFLTGWGFGAEPTPLSTVVFLGSSPAAKRSPLTTSLFLLEGATLCLLLVGHRLRHAPILAALLAAIATAIAIVVLVGYVYGAPLLYGGTFIPVAMPTALAFVLVGLAQMRLAVPGVAVLHTWRHPSLRGRLLRAFLPATLLLIVIEGWADVALGTAHALSPALWHSLTALAAGALIVVITASIAQHAGDDIEQAQAQIRSLSRFADESPGPVLRVARDGSLLYANRTSQRLLAYWRCERPGQMLPERERQRIVETLASGEAADHEVTCGGIVYGLMLIPIPDMGYVNIYGRDVSHLKLAEFELTDALVEAQRLREALNHVSAYIYMKDLQSRYIYANRPTLALFGCSAEELVGCDDTRFFSPATAKRLQEVDSRVFLGQQTSEEIDVADAKGKRNVYWEVKTPIYEEPGSQQVWGLLGVSTDITERKQAEESLRRSKEQLRALATRLQVVREEERIGIARELHDELGQSLTAMQIDLMWLDSQIQNAGPADLTALRDKVAAMVPRTEKMIETTQSISSALRPGVLDQLGLVAAIEWLAEDFGKRTGLVCAASVPAEDLALDTPRDVALFRIVQEALTNVLRHAKATHVDLRLRVTERALVLEVQDNGHGITPEQIAASTSLGLLSMRERAAVFDGTVDVFSDVSEGTTVRVRVPLIIVHSP